MNKKAYIVAAGCLVLGLILGIVSAAVYSGRVVAHGLILLKEIEIVQSGDKAFAAYQRESKPVAIYALTQHLKTLDAVRELYGVDPLVMNRFHIPREEAMTHARLAKIHDEPGESDLKAKHISEALHHIGQVERYRAVTNAATLMELVAKFDDKGVP